MKTIIITSQITYVPENSADFFEQLLQSTDHTIAGVVLVKNFSWNILLKIVWLYSKGCFGIANALLMNIIKLPFEKRIQILKDRNIPIIKTASVDDGNLVEWIKANNIDLVINFRARCLFKTALLKAPKIGCVNMHHGILPKYRGLYCDLYALAERRPAGFSLHEMNDKIDDGQLFSVTEASKASEMDYIKYLSYLGGTEAGVLKEFVMEVKENSSLPKGMPNTVDKPVYTTMPNSSTLSKMRKQGLIL